MSHDLYVVETETDHYLGFVKMVSGAVHISTGKAGRPRVVPLHELVSLVRADQHPDVS